MATVVQHFDPGGAVFRSTFFPQLVKADGTSIPIQGLAYDATSATAEAAFWHFRATNYGSGNLSVEVEWYADTATSGDVVWGVQIGAITPNSDTQDVETKALATAATATDAHLTGTGQRLHTITVTLSGASLDSIANGDGVWMRVYRDSPNAADTMLGDAIVTHVTVSYSDT